MNSGTGRPATGPGHYLRDLVYGGLDGIVTTLAILAGVAGAGFGAHVAWVLGLANLAADGLSMGASNYLGLKSELEQAGRSVAEEQPWRHGGATFAAFVLAGAVPLLAVVVTPAGLSFLPIGAVLAGVALFAIGAARARFLPRPAWRAGMEMLIIGAAAGSLAYGIGYAAQVLI